MPWLHLLATQADGFCLGLPVISAYRKPAFQPSAFRRLFIGFQPSAENQPIFMEKSLSMQQWSKKYKFQWINYMIWWWVKIFLSVWKILKKNFFAWNVLKHKVKPKNSRNSTFFKKLKFPPYFWKTLVKFSSPKCSENFTSVFHK